MENGEQGEFEVSELAEDKYYWRVDVTDGINITKGTVKTAKKCTGVSEMQVECETCRWRTERLMKNVIITNIIANGSGRATLKQATCVLCQTKGTCYALEMKCDARHDDYGDPICESCKSVIAKIKNTTDELNFWSKAPQKCNFRIASTCTTCNGDKTVLGEGECSHRIK